jgi:hypothetical protein
VVAPVAGAVRPLSGCQTGDSGVIGGILSFFDRHWILMMASVHSMTEAIAMNKPMLDDNTDNIVFSLRNGIFMPFLYKGHQVVVHNSSWTFRETIWVDDDLVFTGLGYSLRSTRRIEVAGDQLEVTFGMRKAVSEFFIEVRKDGELIVERAYKPYGSGKNTWLFLIVSMLAGGVCGYFAVKLGLLAFGGE